MKNLFNFILCLVTTGIFLTSCNNSDSDETAGITVKMIDAPGDYAEVNVNVQGIEVIVNDEPHTFTVENPGLYDLLKLTGGNFASLLSENIPAGQLSQIRLILGAEDNAVVMIDSGDTVELQTPSAQQSGLKLNVNYDLQPGVVYNFILDFNADKSVVELGTDTGLVLKPVIRVTTEAESGSVSGTINPATPAVVTATNGVEEITANTNSETGEFLLYGVPEGTYAITITPVEGEAKIINDVVVKTGVTTQMGTIDL